MKVSWLYPPLKGTVKVSPQCDFSPKKANTNPTLHHQKDSFSNWVVTNSEHLTII